MFFFIREKLQARLLAVLKDLKITDGYAFIITRCITRYHAITIANCQKDHILARKGYPC